jgi:dTDP-4-dehydrorhamnose reductase
MRILITGVQGVIGWNLHQDLKKNNRVFGFSKTERNRKGEWYEGLMEDYSRLKYIVDECQPDLVIHSQAMCNIDLCEVKPDKTHLINVEATQKLAQVLKPEKHRLVYISSDHVFSGERGDYTEEDALDPVSEYGRSRVLAEKFLLKHYPNVLIIRPGLALGASLQGDIGPHDWLRRRLTRGLVSSFFVDEIRSPLWMVDLIKGIRLLIDKKCSGVYHLGGKTNFSRFEIANRLKVHWGLEGEVRPKRRQEDKLVPRIAECTLSSTKAEREGWRVPVF